ncbi:unnamed protein product [Darwinula stevensoni]|uniref:HTH CENPB-type domain-containing protein n=1 Tax=Darwinula stevensoni TaxID=69355 RepID=A0A7R8ZZ65_9CRUS|nr:unnamed protein product [Darwinula stevensoni]CAG0882904.1 unnamed protein product [Darwinula stevensoni]
MMLTLTDRIDYYRPVPGALIPSGYDFAMITTKMHFLKPLTSRQNYANGGPAVRQMAKDTWFGTTWASRGTTTSSSTPGRFSGSMPFGEAQTIWMGTTSIIGAMVFPTMREILYGNGGSEAAFLQVVFEEPHLKGSSIPILQDLVLFAVEHGEYDARMRVFIRRLAWTFHVSQDMVELYEESLVEFLSEDHEEKSEEEKKLDAKKLQRQKLKRYALIGLATVSGGALVGLSGGLAAPLIGAGVGTILGGASAAALGSTAGMAVVGSLFGVAGAGLAGVKMKKRIGAVEEFAFDILTEGCNLHLTIAISGWLSRDPGSESFRAPWSTLYYSKEQYCLRYESKYLLELGQAMDYLLSFAVSMAAQEALKYTVLAGLVSAIAWPATLMTVASVIDNPWGVCINRSAQVGQQLAHVLLSRQQGRRPVSLIGFSLGARVIFHCLQEMSKSKRSEGIVQDVIILGGPLSGSKKDWEAVSRVVAGRIINGFCRGDWLLKFLYRTSSINMQIAGLGPILWENPRMYNFDLSKIVSGHLDYAHKMHLILKTIGVRTRDAHGPTLLHKSISDHPVIIQHRQQDGSIDAVPLHASSMPCLHCLQNIRELPPSRAIRLSQSDADLSSSSPRCCSPSINRNGSISGGSPSLASPLLGSLSARRTPDDLTTPPSPRVFHAKDGSEMAHVAKKRKCMSIELKTDILREFEEGKLKKGQISANASFAPGRKKLRGAKYSDIEEALFGWFQQARACNIVLDGNTIRQKAAELAKVLGIDNLVCSSGWLSRFKDRHGIVFKKVCGEAGSVPDEIVNKWKNGTLKSIIGSHRPEDIFNADETSLFFKLTPEKTMQVTHAMEND